MHQEYLDSIGLYQCYGHPHDFATMTHTKSGIWLNSFSMEFNGSL